MVYVFYVNLRGAEEIWRKVAIPDVMTFKKFHEAIQEAFGWSGRHMHEFIIRDPCSGDKVRITENAGWTLRPLDTYDEEHEILKRWVTPATQIVYIYDFEKEYTHDIELIKVLDIPFDRVICIDGEGQLPLSVDAAAVRDEF